MSENWLMGLYDSIQVLEDPESMAVFQMWNDLAAD